MEQFKHLQLPASIKRHYVKLVATGILITVLLMMCYWEPEPAKLYIDPVAIDTSQILIA